MILLKIGIDFCTDIVMTTPLRCIQDVVYVLLSILVESFRPLQPFLWTMEKAFLSLQDASTTYWYLSVFCNTVISNNNAFLDFFSGQRNLSQSEWCIHRARKHKFCYVKLSWQRVCSDDSQMKNVGWTPSQTILNFEVIEGTSSEIEEIQHGWIVTLEASVCPYRYTSNIFMIL